ncbi:ABC transporter ATP-binding protein/permease [Gammaproteobacteria bacterium]|nr:ABC transporter ATP-binding protein/permease [Gammaproteobacteria bacterium]
MGAEKIRVAKVSDSTRYDDRIDVDTELTLRETFVMIGRSLGLLTKVRKLFAYKFVFAIVAVLPAIVLPWLLKIVVDQVVLQQPIDSTVRFPPFLDPFVNLIQGMAPNDIMIALTVLFLVFLVLFGMRAMPSIQSERGGLPEGHDAATQSEQALSAGGSQTSGLWGLLETLLTIRMTQRLANNLRTSLMGRLTRLEMTALDDQRIGDSVYRVMYDAPMLPEICYKITVAPVLLLFNALLSLWMMQYSYGAIAPEIVWLAAALMPMTLILTAPFSGIARRVNQASRAAGASTTNQMEQSVDNINAVQSLGGSQVESANFANKSEESFKRHRITFLVDLVAIALSYSALIIALGFAFILTTDKIIAESLSAGDYAVITGFFFLLGTNARLAGKYWIDLQRNVAAVRRVFFFIDYTSELDSESAPLPIIEKIVELENVSFAYPDGRQVLSDISLSLPLGELVAIVGPTGAGKTTLAYMLPGYIKPSAGRIRFDNVDLVDAGVDEIRKQVTYVFQEHMLLSESIRNNLLLANPQATEEQMLEACRVAGAMDFIDQLPDGIDSMIGKGGDTLSVGQKQRLSIARGIIRDTPILILDEPTAALDPKTENALVETLRNTAQGRLVVVIAHRLSTIREADRIIFLDEGRVRDVGNHESLMAQPASAYRKFVELQNA